MGTKSTKTASSKSFNKSAFVRQFNDDTAAEIVKRAKQHGVTITPAYVYNIRATAKKLAKGKPRPAAARRAVLERVGAVSPMPARKPAPVRSALQISLDDIAMQFVDQVLETLRHASMRDIAEA